MSVMNGFRHELLSRMLGLNGHVTGAGDDGGPLHELRRRWPLSAPVPGVLARVRPTIDGQVLVTANGVAIRRPGARHARSGSLNAHQTFPIAVGWRAGGFHRWRSVIIGARMAEQAAPAYRRSITLIAPRGNVTPFGITPRIKTYTIAGTFDIGMIEYDHDLCLHAAGRSAALFQSGSTGRQRLK